MNQITCCNWLSERARWSYLARLGLSGVSLKKNFPESHIINPLLTKLVCKFIDLDFVSVHKLAKKNLADIQPS